MIALGGVAALSVAVASSSVARTVDVNFTSGLPSQVFEGQKLTIDVTVDPASPLCVLTIRYKGGRTDRRTRAAKTKHASWTFRVPAVPPGKATVTVSCKGAGKRVGTMLVQWALQPPQLSIGKRGWSQRMFDTTSDVSYGLAVTNQRVRFDAVNVAVLVNFVDSSNRILGSAHSRVDLLPAGSTFYAGGQQQIPTLTPVSRLEVVITSARSAQKVISVPPLVSDLTIVPDRNGVYVDSVRGQLLNNYRVPMQSGALGVVVVDAAGNIVGGGFSDAQGPLSFGAREFFSACCSFSAVPVSKAAGALVSPVPTYPPPP